MGTCNFPRLLLVEKGRDAQPQTASVYLQGANQKSQDGFSYSFRTGSLTFTNVEVICPRICITKSTHNRPYDAIYVEAMNRLLLPLKKVVDLIYTSLCFHSFITQPCIYDVHLASFLLFTLAIIYWLSHGFLVITLYINNIGTNLYC